MQKIVKKNLYSNLLAIFVVYILLNMIIFPKFYIQQTFAGITAWAINVLPSLLPFIFFSKILSSLNLIDKITKIFQKPFKKLFNTPAISSYSFFSSVISGYPVGAKITEELYSSGKITRTDACKMLSFCSTSGPMFIIGAVGAGMFNSTLAGYIMFTSHVLGAFLNGIIYRNIKVKEFDLEFKQIEKENKKLDISSIVLDTALSVISVGTIIAIFFVIVSSLSPIFSLLPNNISAVLSGFFEITKGCIDLSSNFSLFMATLIGTFIISFGGFSTLLQTQAMTTKLKLPIGLYFLQKISHALLSTVIAFVLCCLFL